MKMTGKSSFHHAGGDMSQLISVVLLISGLVIFAIRQQLEIRSLRRRLKTAQEDADSLASYCRDARSHIADLLLMVIKEESTINSIRSGRKRTVVTHDGRNKPN